MRIVLFLIVICLLQTETVKAQSGPYSRIIYDNNGMGVEAEAILSFPDSSYLISGSNFGNGILVKVNKSGTIRWQKVNTQGSNQFFYLVPTLNDGFYTVGEYDTLGGLSGDVNVSRFDSIGNQIWSRSLKFTNNSLYPLSAAKTYDDGIALCGFMSNGSGSYYISWLTKLDSLGNLVFSEKLNSLPSGIIAQNVFEMPDSTLHLSGMFFDTVPSTHRGMIIHLSPAGSVIKTNLYRYPGSNGNAMYAGTNYNGETYSMLASDTVAGLVRIDANDSVINTRFFHSVYDVYCVNCRRPTFAFDGTSNFYFCGGDCFGSTMYRVDSSLNLLYAQQIQMETTAMATGFDKNLYIAGNGPVCILRTSSPTSNHIGVIKEDSSLTNLPCVTQYELPQHSDHLQTDSVHVVAATAGSIYPVSMTFTPLALKTYLGCVVVPPSSIDEYSEIPYVQLTIGPDGLLFTCESQLWKELFLFDLQGRMVYSSALTGASKSIPVSSFSSGMYVYRILFLNGALKSGKAMIKND